MQKDKQHIKSRFRHSHSQPVYRPPVAMRHAVFLYPLVSPFIHRMLQAHRHAVYLDGYIVGMDVIVLVVLHLFLDSTRLGEYLPDSRTGCVIVLFAHEHIHVSP